MKLSNFMLSIVASVVVGLAIGANALVTNEHPTAVISLTTEDGAVGGGFTMKLPEKISGNQARILSVAYDIAKRDGHSQPQILQGIVLQETKAGGMSSYKVAGQEFGLKTNERYYGLAQLKLSATKDVMSRYPELWKQFNFQTRMDEELIAKLIENDNFNLSVASKYLLILKASGYNTVKQMALAYNQGPGGAKSQNAETHHYSTGVMAHIQKLKL
jgi:hypothetical protein